MNFRNISPLSLVLLLCIISFAGSTYAQTKSAAIDKTKLNGIWIFNAKASRADAEAKSRYKDQDLTITYNDPELKIIEPRTRPDPKTNQVKTLFATMVFYTDGRGETTKPYAFNQNAEFDSITCWQGDVLIRKYAVPITYNGKLSGNSQHVEKYSLSEDGMTLTIVMESKIDAAAAKALLESNEVNKTIRVYRKK